MGVVLDHLVVPSRDKERSAKFLARILGLQYQGPVAHFAPVRINSALTFDFDNYTDFARLHYAFKVDSSDFDDILNRVRSGGIPYGSGPSLRDMKVYEQIGGRG